MNVVLRTIEEADLELVMNWRMRPDITKYMNTDPILTLESQKNWLENIAKDPTCMYWLIQVEGIPGGVINICNINREKKSCEWGYYIGETKLRSLKLAMNLEWSLYAFVFEKLKFDALYNEVLDINKGVVKLHLACGSRIVQLLKNHVTKNESQYDVIRMGITYEEWETKRKSLNYENINFNI